jgi:hypothetical protein
VRGRHGDDIKKVRPMAVDLQGSELNPQHIMVLCTSTPYYSKRDPYYSKSSKAYTDKKEMPSNYMFDTFCFSMIANDSYDHSASF